MTTATAQMVWAKGTIRHLLYQSCSPGSSNATSVSSKFIACQYCVLSKRGRRMELVRGRRGVGVGLVATFTVGSYPLCRATWHNMESLANMSWQHELAKLLVQWQGDPSPYKLTAGERDTSPSSTEPPEAATGSSSSHLATAVPASAWQLRLGLYGSNPKLRCAGTARPEDCAVFNTAWEHSGVSLGQGHIHAFAPWEASASPMNSSDLRLLFRN